MALKVVIAGMGPRGRGWAREVNEHPSFELVGCADPDPNARARGVAEVGVPARRCLASLADALDECAPEVVIVATSIDHHAEPSELALSRGLGVLIEKPFTRDLAEAARLVALGDSNGAPIVVGQNYRYLRAYRATRRLVRKGAIGRIGSVTAHIYNQPSKAPESLAEVGNSVLWEVAIHRIDALAYVLDRQVTGVMARSFSSPGSRLPPEPSLQAMLTLEGDVRAVLTATYESRGHERFERGQEYYQRLTGERGTLHMLQRWVILCRAGRLPRLVRRGRRPVTEEALLLDQMYNAVRHGIEPDSSGRDNLATIAAVAACARSTDEGRWIDPRVLLNEVGGE